MFNQQIDSVAYGLTVIGGVILILVVLAWGGEAAQRTMRKRKRAWQRKVQLGPYQCLAGTPWEITMADMDREIVMYAVRSGLVYTMAREGAQRLTGSFVDLIEAARDANRSTQQLAPLLERIEQ